MIQWLEWLMEKSRRKGEPLYIQHALNKGEYKIPNTKYKIDGYCSSTNTAYEFHGCLYHGCISCFKDNRHRLILPRTKQTANELFVLTLKKAQFIKSLGMKYIEIWEHGFNYLLQNDPEVRQYTDSLDIQERLNPRDSFFGGKTNAIKLRYDVKEKERIAYCDFTSLYPACNKYGVFPIRHPTIITSDLCDLDLDKIFGIVKIKVLPPKKLFFPVLPLRIDGKLTFPLCRSCVQTHKTNVIALTKTDLLSVRIAPLKF